MELIYPLRPIYWDDVIHDIKELLGSPSGVYLVGGTVRDAYRDYPFKDIDLACEGNGQPIARKIANAFGGAYYPLDKKRGVGRAIIEVNGRQLTVDVAALRGDLLADLQTRDFTLNAMCVPLDTDLSGIYDPLGGIQDWHHRMLRRCSPNSITDDPIRTLRAIRQSITLGLTIEPQTRQDIREAAPLLANVSMERIRDEFCALLDTSKPAAGLAVLKVLGLLQYIIPETLEQPPERWAHSQKAIEQLHQLLTVISPRRDDNIAANAAFGTFVYMLDRFRPWLQEHVSSPWPEDRNQRILLLLGSLLLYLGENDEQGAALAASRGVALKLSRDEVISLEDMILQAEVPWQLHLEGNLDAREVYRYWRGAGISGLDACFLAMVEYLSERITELETPKWTAYLLDIGKLFDGYKIAMDVTPFLTGNDLMTEFGLQPGKEVGQVLEVLREAQALGEITTPQEALEFAAQWLNSQGFTNL